MTYSVEAFLFRAAVGVVNTAARAANAVLQTMYPQDISHIWGEDFPGAAGSLADGCDASRPCFCYPSVREDKQRSADAAAGPQHGLSSSVAGVAAGSGAAPPQAADPGGVTDKTPTSTPPGSLPTLREQIQDKYDDARVMRAECDIASFEYARRVGECTALASVLGMLDNLIEAPSEVGPQLW